MSLPQTPKQWTKQSNNQSFLISTDKTLLSLPAINTAFASDAIYWANPLPDESLQAMIDNSFCFGLYKTPASDNEQALQQIGFARLITDGVTLAYLTDVYILPDHQGLGLGGWILDCVDELVKPLPHLRWFLLRTGEETSLRAYRKRYRMEVMDNGDLGKGALFMGRKGDGNRV
ncbi:uncharacterized protein DSM5745_11173 [Aspergillus mulundensis]|uniref:N-acetyltransferase domain-containing protein n=1 Tax=Aspergillus mulundensis TaxID=1810919 RepID=A0A3D8QB93_9EURO|nr:hypothetical protein DSM5745_11173 [Aspergillus mulundensis]RDW58967.1 hypothetical protein DSM5745_11173 [Aspergillus mulundensis]